MVDGLQLDFQKCFTNMNTRVIPDMDEDKTYYETKVSS